MAVIAFLTNNITIGTLWGSFGVLLIAVEKHLGVGRELSTLGVPAVTMGWRYARRSSAFSPAASRCGCCCCWARS